MCNKKASGGLDLSNLEIRNHSLLAKWNWKFRTDRGKLWHQAVTGKYGDLSIMSNEPQTPLSPIMEGLVNLKRTLHASTLQNLQFRWWLRDGELIDFWNDHWHQIGVLSSHFDRLYQLAIRKKILVKNMVAFWRSDGDNRWRRQLRGWELDEAAELQF